MALTPQQIQILAAQLKEIEVMAKKVGMDMSGINLKPVEKDAKAIVALFISLNKQTRQFAQNIDDAYEDLKSIADSFKKQNTTIKDTSKVFSSLTSIAEKLKFHSEGIYTLNKKDISSLQSKMKMENDRLSRLSAELILVTNKSKEEQKTFDTIIDYYNLQDGAAQTISKKFDKINTQLKEQNRLMGLGGNLISGSVLLLDKMGMGSLTTYLNIDKAKDSMEKLADEISRGEKNGNRLTVLSKGLGVIFGGLGKILTDPLALLGGIMAGLLKFDTLTGELAENLGLSHHEASGIAGQLNDIANSSNNVYLNTKNLTESYLAINKSLGLNADISEESLKTYTHLREQLELSEGASLAFYKVTQMIGGTMADNVEIFEEQIASLNASNHTSLGLKDTMEEMKDMSAATSLTLGNQPKALAQAVFEAKRLGFTLDGLNESANSLLNFESSISDQIEAEVITGRQLNLEQARYYALMGDTGNLAKELAKNLGTSADFSKMNVIAQESLAKSFGMTRDSLAITLMRQEQITKSGEKEGQSRHDILEEQMKAEDVQKRMAAVMVKFQEVLISLAPIIMPLADAFVEIMQHISAAVAWTGKWGSGLSMIALLIIPSIRNGLTGILGSFGSLFKGVKGLLSFTPGKILGGGAGSAISSAGKPAEAMSKANGEKIGSSLKGLGSGLKEMSGPKVLWGVANLAAFAVAGVLAIPSLIFLGGIALLGPSAMVGLEALGMGLSALGGAASAGLIGVGLIAALGVAMIPFGYALSLAAPAMKVMTDAFQNFFDSLSLEKIGNLALLGPALASAAVGIGLFSLALATGGVASLFGAGIMLELALLSSMAPSLSNTAVAIKMMADSIKELKTQLSGLDNSKIEALNDLVTSSSRNSVINGIGSAISKPLTMIGGMINGGDSKLTAQELKAIREILVQIRDKKSDIHLDGNKVGIALSQGMATYKI